MSPFETGALSAFIGTLPVLLIVILAWIQVNAKIAGMKRERYYMKEDIARQLLENRETFRTEILRVEEVLDSRLQRLEES